METVKYGGDSSGCRVEYSIVLFAYARVAMGGRLALEGANQQGLVRVRECEGEVRHRSRTYVRQLQASEGRILWGVLPSLAFCPVRDALSQSASAASLGLC